MKTPVRTRLLSALLSLVMLVSLLPVSVFAAEPASGTWERLPRHRRTGPVNT